MGTMIVKVLFALAFSHMCYGQGSRFAYLRPTTPATPIDVTYNCPEPSPEIDVSYITKFVYSTTEALKVFPTTTKVTSTSTKTSIMTSTSISVETKYTTVVENYMLVTPVYTNTLIVHTSSIPNQVITNYTALIKPKYAQVNSEDVKLKTTSVYEVRYGTTITTARHTTRVLKRSYTVEYEQHTVDQPKKTKAHFTTTTLTNTTNVVLPRQTVTHLKTVVKHVTQTEYVVPPPVLKTKTWRSFKVSTEFIDRATVDTLTITNTMTQFFEKFNTVTMTPTLYTKTNVEAYYLFPHKPTKYVEVSTEFTRSEFSTTVSPLYVPTSTQTIIEYKVINTGTVVPGIPIKTVNLEELIHSEHVQFEHVITSTHDTTVFSTDVQCDVAPTYRYGEPATRRDYL